MTSELDLLLIAKDLLGLPFGDTDLTLLVSNIPGRRIFPRHGVPSNFEVANPKYVILGSRTPGIFIA